MVDSFSCPKPGFVHPVTDAASSGWPVSLPIMDERRQRTPGITIPPGYGEGKCFWLIAAEDFINQEVAMLYHFMVSLVQC